MKYRQYYTPLSFKVSFGFNVVYILCINTNAIVMSTEYTYRASNWFFELSKKLNKSKVVKGKISGNISADDIKSIFIPEIQQSINIVDARYLYKLREMK